MFLCLLYKQEILSASSNPNTFMSVLYTYQFVKSTFCCSTVAEIYVNDAKKGNIVSEGSPEILSERGGTAWVHGHNLLGKIHCV